MDFEPTDDQVALRTELRRFLAERVTPEARRAIMDRPGAVDRDLWRALGGMGIFALTLPEDAGGVGLGLADATLVFEELGRAAVPGPLIGTFLAARLAADGVEVARRAAAGDAVVGLTPAGSPAFVEHLDALDALLVVGAGGVTPIEPPTGGRPVGPPPRPADPGPRPGRPAPRAAAAGRRRPGRAGPHRGRSAGGRPPGRAGRRGGGAGDRLRRAADPVRPGHRQLPGRQAPAGRRPGRRRGGPGRRPGRGGGGRRRRRRRRCGHGRRPRRGPPGPPGRRRGPHRRLPVRRRRRPAPASRSTGAWATPGSSTPTCS